MANQLAFRPKTSEIPTSPGVYRFYDASGRVLYVGKAKNLRARLSNYFGPLTSLPERTRRMLLMARDVRWVLVPTEIEALQLEYTWIKEYDPPFNVRFRDDKSYPYLAISISETFPRVFITRNRELKGVKYFGPFIQSWALRETLDLLLKVYPVRSCSQGVFQRAQKSKRPCLLGDIGKCAAPCVGRIDEPDHRALAQSFGEFMASGDTRHVTGLRAEMAQAAEAQEYERAAKLRDDIAALEGILAKTSVVLSDQTDADIFAISDDDLIAAVSLFKVRGGRIRAARSWLVEKEIECELSDLVEPMLETSYGEVEASEIPPQVMVPAIPSASMQQWLSDRRGAKIEFRVPQRGEKAALAETALQNAQHALQLFKMRRASDFNSRSEALHGLQERLGLAESPLRIECFDISHLGQSNQVASMVVFEDALPKKAHYRLFNLENPRDDTEAIYQVLSRRLKYLSGKVDPDLAGSGRFAYRPSLLVIDGGLPQLHAAERAIADSGVSGLSVVSLAKRLEEVWLPGSDFPVILPRQSEELFLLQRIRDEAHRFAIEHQRRKRSKGIGSELAEIPGLGEKRIKLLLKRFGSVKRLRVASEAEIAETARIGPVLAAEIIRRLNAEKSPEENLGAPLANQ